MWRIATHLIRTIAVKSGQLVGNSDTFTPIFSDNALGFDVAI